MKIRHLGPEDAAIYQALRLEGLQNSPAAFGASYEAEAGRSLAEVAARLQAGSAAKVFGAFSEDKLVGIAALVHTDLEKLAHNATIGGMYVTPAHRGHGVGGTLLDTIISYAQVLPRLRNLKLTVNASNTAAITLYRSRGFIPFGLEREAIYANDTYWDEAYYALPLSQWR